ncbi:MAG TPA: purine-nucleoside phosphorylase [Elusimicrobiota bacterium]|jgi:purine-nucleoside phosphorylase|nr:purine-nucleoside phosphorylase [Elusimicrobiota bacterium]
MKREEYLQTVRAASERIQALKPPVSPRIAVILGSGVGSACPALEDTRELAYEDVPGFAGTTVQGHRGRLILGRLPGSGVGVAVLQGRIHFFEGHSLADVTLLVRAVAGLGVKTLVVTSAVGSLKPAIKPGHLVVLKDHINFMGHNPLRGLHTPAFGPMFPDLVDAYTPALRKLALAACRRKKVPAREGVYVAVGGPSYETPAEIRAFAKLGGDVVGMSTVPEVIAARQLGLDVLVLSWISNLAAGISKTALTHEEVLELGQKMSGRLRAVLEDVLPRIG